MRTWISPGPGCGVGSSTSVSWQPSPFAPAANCHWRVVADWAVAELARMYGRAAQATVRKDRVGTRGSVGIVSSRSVDGEGDGCDGWAGAGEAARRTVSRYEQRTSCQPPSAEFHVHRSGGRALANDSVRRGKLQRRLARLSGNAVRHPAEL